MNEKDFLSVGQVQITLGISKNKAYELVHSEGFPVVRIGRRIVVPVRQFESWVERQTGFNK